MSDVEIKSRAKRILTIQLTREHASPRFPMQPVTLRRSRTVKHQADPVPHDVPMQLPPVLTVLPGEKLVVPAAFLRVEQLQNALRSREVVKLRDIVNKPPASAPPPPPAALEKPKKHTRKAASTRRK